MVASVRPPESLEHVFPDSRLLHLPPQAEPGPMALFSSASPVLEQPCRAVFTVNPDADLWLILPAFPDPLRQLRTTPGVFGIVARGRPELGQPHALAVAFLHSLLLQRAAGTQAIVVSVDPKPLLAAGLLPVLHLITHDSSGTLEDVALWEGASPAEVCAWYGGFVPSTHTLHDPDQVLALLALRRAAREGRLDDSPDAQALLSALRERVFDGRFVLQHIALIERLLMRSGELAEGLRGASQVHA